MTANEMNTILICSDVDFSNVNKILACKYPCPFRDPRAGSDARKRHVAAVVAIDSGRRSVRQVRGSRQVVLVDRHGPSVRLAGGMEAASGRACGVA